MLAQSNHTTVQLLLDQLDSIILGNPQATKLSLVCLLAQGHLLIEDIPGVGKTTLSHALAKSLGLGYKRVQFTSDLLPTDLIGVTIYDLDTKKFKFKRGPIFTSVLLADEINRATPKSQSALLQAMEEREVAVEGNQFKLPSPFFVIATQNPLEQSGTFPLPESQLDRFLMRISLGYPDAKFEKDLLLQAKGRPDATSIVSTEQLKGLIDQVNAIHINENLVDYLHAILLATRNSGKFVNGLSPRAGLQWLQACKALALVEGAEAVIPDHVKYLAPFTAAHRLQCNDGSNSADELSKIISDIEVL